MQTQNFKHPPKLEHTFRIERAPKVYGNGYSVVMDRTHLPNVFGTLDAAVEAMEHRAAQDEIDPFSIFWVFGATIQIPYNFRFVFRGKNETYGPFPVHIARQFVEEFGGKIQR